MRDVLNNTFKGGALVWEAPPVGWLKINVDAACFDSGMGTGCDVVERNQTGAWVSAFTNRKAECLSPIVAEGWALKEALSWIKSVKKQKDCVSLLNSLVDIKVIFVYHFANCVVHSLARATYSMTGRKVWVDSPPYFLTDVLRADYP
ncbi:uncharacterized protein LOC126687956 [Mercurialis annua]|uniref:uncharacterized protein LOC126687956 n=1 Tax=Mercurialis annua TaxID=3986 RepID=UPI00215F8AC6|nr:uncharacterized protein LOC126687956 [Mercurialis annua]